jgi:hypothetical protein
LQARRFSEGVSPRQSRQYAESNSTLLHSARLHRARALTLSLFLLLAASAQAEAQTRGLAPDAQVTGGIGAALHGKLDNVFLARARLGVLYALDKYWIAAGAIGEVGALPGLSIGGELEFNQDQGWFTNAGLTYAEHKRVTGHLALGYLVFGLEWQHDFTRDKPNEALLATIRLPLGFWWFTSNREKSPRNSQPPAARAAKAAQARSAQPTAPARSPAQDALDEAALAQAQADHAALAAALRRAYALEPDPLLWLRIADADLALNKPALALEDLQRFLASAGAGSALAQRAQVEARIQELNARVARVRLTLAAASGGERVELDGSEQPGALAGYDVLLDPGAHVLRIRRGTELLLEHAFEAQPGELVRLDLQLPAAAAAPR